MKGVETLFFSLESAFYHSYKELLSNFLLFITTVFYKKIFIKVCYLLIVLFHYD